MFLIRGFMIMGMSISLLVALILSVFYGLNKTYFDGKTAGTCIPQSYRVEQYTCGQYVVCDWICSSGSPCVKVCSVRSSVCMKFYVNVKILNVTDGSSLVYQGKVIEVSGLIQNYPLYQEKFCYYDSNSNAWFSTAYDKGDQLGLMVSMIVFFAVPVVLAVIWILLEVYL